MKTHTWLTLFEKTLTGPSIYHGKFGCKVSLDTYVYFKQLNGQLFMGTIELPDG